MFNRVLNKLVLPTLLFAVILAGPALAIDDVVVIAHPSVSVSRLGKDELARIYQKKMTRWPDGVSIVPVDTGGAGDTQVRFYQSVLGMTVGEVSNFWIRQAMTVGIEPPRSFRSPELVIRYVSITPGAIGYVAPGTSLDGVKAISIQ